MIRKLKNKVFNLKKSGLREHIQNFKQGRIARIYKNEFGEKFSITRHKSGNIYTININPTANSQLNCIAEVHVKKKSKTIFISDVKKLDRDYKTNTNRNIFGVVLDECQEIAQKEFRDWYNVELVPSSDAVEEYYTKVHGFRRIDIRFSQLRKTFPKKSSKAN